MGHRNTQFNGHMNDMETDQQGHINPHSKPCIFYGNLSNIPHPSFHPMIPTPGNQGNFNFHHMPERHDSALFCGLSQLNGPQNQHPTPNLDLAIAAPSGHYSPYIALPSGIRDFPVQDHGTHEQLSLSSTHGVVGIPTDTYTRTIPYMDCIRASFKRKNTEGASGSFQYHNASASPSSLVAPVTAMTAESDVNLFDPASFLPPEYGGNDPTLIAENGSQISARNRLRMVGHESVVAHNTGHLIQGNFAAPPIQLPGNSWLDMHFGANNGDIGTFAWTTHTPIPYTHVPDMSASNRSPGGFLPPPIPQGHLSAHNPTPSMQGIRGFNINLQSQVAASTHQISTINSSNTGINNFQDIVDAGSSFVGPVPRLSFRSYRPHRREIMLNSSATHQALPHMRVLPEDEVAILGFPGYHEAGDAIDQHRDMRLDIDHMSYEELLALGEQIGSVGTGLSVEFVRNHLKIRTFSSTSCINLEEAACPDQQMNFCVICQMDYEDEEDIGTVDCGHEYHSVCIKKWLLTKNTCPVCKSTALNLKGVVHE